MIKERKAYRQNDAIYAKDLWKINFPFFIKEDLRLKNIKKMMDLISKSMDITFIIKQMINSTILKNTLAGKLAKYISFPAMNLSQEDIYNDVFNIEEANYLDAFDSIGLKEEEDSAKVKKVLYLIHNSII